MNYLCKSGNNSKQDSPAKGIIQKGTDKQTDDFRKNHYDYRYYSFVHEYILLKFSVFKQDLVCSSPAISARN